MLANDPAAIVRTVVVGACSYALLVLALRISGKRTLAKLNAFDLVVTVALGSTLSSALTSTNVSVAQGATAFALLVGLQYAVSRTSLAIPRFRRLVTSRPTLIAGDGQLRREAMTRERITEAEVRAALRQAGLGDLAAVVAVVLETDGSLSVVPESRLSTGWALEGVLGWNEHADRRTKKSHDDR